jgi:L-lactate dehydrogenase complex protein LldG
MAMTASARDNILGRIRSALGRVQAPASGSDDAGAGGMRARLAGHPRGPLPSMDWEPVARFEERCRLLSSSVARVRDRSEVAPAVAQYLARNDLPRSGVCWSELGGLGWSAAGLRIEPRSAGGEDKVGITGCYCAIADTGTLMLLSGPDTPLTTSLLPDTHIALVPASRILRSMEDAWDLLRRESAALPRQVAFVSGPSRTADIEMTLVLGIHGPYRVHVILVDE